MAPDDNDTIVAPATAAGVGSRGVVRVTGPDALGVLSALAGDHAPDPPPSPRRLPGLPIEIQLAGRSHRLPFDAWVWPTARSYTRQPTVELHTHASGPLVDAVVRACCRHGARLAKPGEFTLRAFLSGRIDLTQAEAVLGVIDADSSATLDHALSRLAGGISTPLQTLREDLTQLLAELEAGLDFVDEEDIRFVEPAELANRVAAGQSVLRAAIDQAANRGEASAYPTVTLAGPPNAGKSCLFNALRERTGVDSDAADAIVSPLAGTTRDTLASLLQHDGVRFWLVDTAGVDEPPTAGIDAVAADHTIGSVSAADLVLRCVPINEPPVIGEEEITVLTKTDQPQTIPLPVQGEGPGEGAEADARDAPTPNAPLHAGRRSVKTSAATGAGLDNLLTAIVSRLAAVEATKSSLAAGVSARCRQALATCEAALDRAAAIATDGDDELVAEELRQALAALGDVVGTTATDDLLDRIFGQFCIGK